MWRGAISMAPVGRDDDDLDEAAGGQRGAISTTPTSWTMTT
jgi:hypothetical protein